MIIKREINGTVYEFELTRAEAVSAFEEVQRGYDQDDVKECIPLFLEDHEEYTEAQIEEKLPTIVKAYRKGVDYIDWWDIARCAINDCMREY